MMDLFLTNMQVFTSQDVNRLCGLRVDYCDVFISCLDSHSDGTHSLQRMHWCNATFLQICSDEETLIYTLDDLWVNKILAIFHFGWTIFFFKFSSYFKAIILIHITTMNEQRRGSGLEKTRKNWNRNKNVNCRESKLNKRGKKYYDLGNNLMFAAFDPLLMTKTSNYMSAQAYREPGNDRNKSALTAAWARVHSSATFDPIKSPVLQGKLFGSAQAMYPSTK